VDGELRAWIFTNPIYVLGKLFLKDPMWITLRAEIDRPALDVFRALAHLMGKEENAGMRFSCSLGFGKLTQADCFFPNGGPIRDNARVAKAFDLYLLI
jgi:hypothetical protein